MNLNQVTVQALDVDESIRFYQALGLVLIVEAPHYARFECPVGDSTFSVHRADQAKPSNTVVYFEVPDVEAVVNELRGKGLTILSGPVREPWLWHEARLEDPAGNPVCIYSAGDNRKNPPWRIN